MIVINYAEININHATENSLSVSVTLVNLRKYKRAFSRAK
jgi:hypothetical protein